VAQDQQAFTGIALGAVGDVQHGQHRAGRMLALGLGLDHRGTQARRCGLGAHHLDHAGDRCGVVRWRFAAHPFRDTVHQLLRCCLHPCSLGLVEK